MTTHQDNQKTKRFYGRRQNRPLNTSRAEAMDALLPALSIPIEDLKEDGSLDPATLFPAPLTSSRGSTTGSDAEDDTAIKSRYDGKEAWPRQIWYEIGFGQGEHLAELLRRHPENAYIGAEPFINGMAAFLKEISTHPSSRGSTTGSLDTEDDTAIKSRYDGKDYNIRVHNDDAMMVANSLADESVDGLYILNPDPWHKRRHYKRRIVRRETLAAYHRILKPGGQLICSTDVPDLADWMITEVMLHGGFEWTAKSANDWRTPPDDWITTAYEVKGAKGAKVMSYLFFERN